MTDPPAAQTLPAPEQQAQPPKNLTATGSVTPTGTLAVANLGPHIGSAEYLAAQEWQRLQTAVA